MDRLNRIASGYVDAKILLTGAQLRVFDHLRRPGATVEAVAAAVGGQVRGVRILLDALVALEIVAKTGELYVNEPDCEAALVSDGPTQLAALLRHRNRCFRRWAFLEETIRGDSPSLDGFSRRSHEDPELNADFIRGMFAASHERVGEVLDHVDLAAVRTVADVGGGPGHYLVELARRLPDATPILVDLPETLAVAGGLLAESGVGERVRLLAWDVYADPPPTELPPLDLAFVSQLVHAEGESANRGLLAKLHGAMAPGGRVVIHENVVDPCRTSPRAGALFAVNMLAMTERGRTYSAEELEGWGREAGFDVEPGERVAERSHLVRLRRP